MQYSQELPAVGVKPGLTSYIMCLRNNPGISQERMAAIMAVEKSSVAKAVRQLVAEGYASCSVNPECRRENILTPTPRTEEAYRAILSVKKKVHARLTRDMTGIERDLFLQLLGKVSLD